MVLTLHGTRTTALPVLVAARFQGVGIALNESTPVVDSQGNATVVLETKHGDIRSVGACLRYVANLSAASAFGGLTAFHRAQIDQWIGWAFNELLPRRLASAIASKREMLQSLVNMGIRGSCIQLSLRARAKTLLEDLKGLNELLLSRSFLVGDAITAADVAAVASLNDPVNFFLTAAERAAVPNVMRWFNTVRGQPEFVTVAGPTTIAGPREGGMIDLRPRPEEVAALAEASVALNAGFKKKQSQRQKEKAQKGQGKAENSQPGAGAGAGAGAAAAEVALVAATAEQPATNMTDKDLTVDQRITKVETKLQELSIDFKTIKHAAAHTVDDLLAAVDGVDCVPCKNLFLKAKKPREDGDSMLWLVVAQHNTPSKMKKIQAELGYNKIVMRFAKDDLLLANLGVIKGSVTPFAAMNDTMQVVNIAIDKTLVGKTNLAIHPLTNEASTLVTYDDLVKFLTSTGHTVTVIDFSE